MSLESEANKVSVVRFCPKCGSAAVDFSQLAGGQAVCRACSWRGTVDQLTAAPAGLGDETELFVLMAGELKKLLGAQLKEYIVFLAKWGFVQTRRQGKQMGVDSKDVARYMAVMARGMVSALAEEREKEEKERVGQSTSDA